MFHTVGCFSKSSPHGTNILSYQLTFLFIPQLQDTTFLRRFLILGKYRLIEIKREEYRLRQILIDSYL